MSTTKNKSLVIGVTGGIGSGKSAVTQMLSERGITVVDADVIARKVVEPGTKALKSIAEHFGSNILRADGTLDRGALRTLVFEDEAQRKWLEALLHPLIRLETIEQLQTSASPYCVLSSPLLLETNQNQLVDKVLLVDASEAQQLARTQHRDGVDANAVAAIMASQWSREDRQAIADFTIVNDGTLSELEVAVDNMHQHFLALATSYKAK